MLRARNEAKYPSFYNRPKSQFRDEFVALWDYGHAIKSALKEAGCPDNSFIETTSAVSELSSILESGRGARGGISITLQASCLSSKNE